ncbi:copia protein, partial [Trifolium medium]|nr:copia protein [Trifolium medium]
GALQYLTFTRPDISYVVQQAPSLTAYISLPPQLTNSPFILMLTREDVRTPAEAEDRGVANIVSESCWLRNLLLELQCHIMKATLVYCDNVSAVYL